MASTRETADESAPICPLCLRPIPADARQSRHHLVPRLKGGKNGPTALLHQICHNEIHAALTEAEIARDYPTIEALRTHKQLAAFVKWVSRKSPHFYAPSTGYHRKRNKR